MANPSFLTKFGNVSSLEKNSRAQQLARAYQVQRRFYEIFGWVQTGHIYSFRDLLSRAYLLIIFVHTYITASLHHSAKNVTRHIRILEPALWFVRKLHLSVFVFEPILFLYSAQASFVSIRSTYYEAYIRWVKD